MTLTELLGARSVLFLDIECTCFLGVEDERQAQEVIEFGLCFRKGPDSTLEPQSLYVRPVSTVVNRECEALTGITPAMLEGQPTFQEREGELSGLIREQGVKAWASWGEFDRQQVRRQCVGQGVDNPLDQLPHVNLRHATRSGLRAMTRSRGVAWPEGANKGVGLQRAAAMTGLAFEGRPHSGAADAYNAARVAVAVAEWVAAHAEGFVRG